MSTTTAPLSPLSSFRVYFTLSRGGEPYTAPVAVRAYNSEHAEAVANHRLRYVPGEYVVSARVESVA